jgi:hypothetical protein
MFQNWIEYDCSHLSDITSLFLLWAFPAFIHSSRNDGCHEESHTWHNDRQTKNTRASIVWRIDRDSKVASASA